MLYSNDLFGFHVIRAGIWKSSYCVTSMEMLQLCTVVIVVFRGGTKK